MTLKKVGGVTTGALTALALFIGACGGNDAVGDVAAPEPTNTTTASASPTLGATPAAQPSALTLVAESVQFKQRSLSAPAGPVTIAFDNSDSGIPHNVHVFAGNDASGASLGSTDIQAGAVQQTLELRDLAPGSYFYQCDVHPSRMFGTLTVS
jgi:plastocyanin